MLARTACAALRKVGHRFHRPKVRMKRGLVIRSSAHTNSVWVPHVRASVRGLIKTGRSPIKALTSFPQSRTWVGPISRSFLARCGIPPLYPRRSSPPSVLLHSPGWSVSSQRAACSASTQRVQTGNPGDRSGGTCCFFHPATNPT
jgi:hypothetical protein